LNQAEPQQLDVRRVRGARRGAVWRVIEAWRVIEGAREIEEMCA
jgi:hypothetical protein